MDFITLKNNYIPIKFKFNPKMKFTGGNAGSKNIIFIDKYVYKIIPYFYKHPTMLYRSNNDQKEIDIYKLITKHILIKKYTPHIVGYYFNYKTPITDIFGKCPSLKEQYTQKQKDKYKTNICSLKYMFSCGVIQKNADVVVIEKCKDNIITHIKNNNEILAQIIDRILFQAIITLVILQEVFPGFVHNDFFIRNILAIEESHHKNEYVHYIYKNKHFYIPADGIYIKINDFGYAISNKMTSTVKYRISKSQQSMPKIDCNKCDIFNLIHDLYDGQNIGTISLMQLKGFDKKLIKKTLNKYINTNEIDKINKNNKKLLNHTWGIKDNPYISSLVKTPLEYLNSNVFNQYTKIPDGVIVNTYKYP